MRLTVWGKLMLAAVVVAAGYGIIKARGHAGRVDQLAQLSDCGLAADYFSWRSSFEDTLGVGQTTISGAQLDRFVTASELYRDAIGRHGSDLPPFLVKLQGVVQQDADKSNDSVAPVGSALASFFVGCPSEAEQLLTATSSKSD